MWPHESWKSIDSHKETEVGGRKYVSVDLPYEVSEDRNKWLCIDTEMEVIPVRSLQQCLYNIQVWIMEKQF